VQPVAAGTDAAGNREKSESEVQTGKIHVTNKQTVLSLQGCGLILLSAQRATTTPTRQQHICRLLNLQPNCFRGAEHQVVDKVDIHLIISERETNMKTN
jgi:hypothetical protein